MKTYIHKPTGERVKAKVFRKGDEDGIKAVRRAEYSRIPYINDLHQREISGHYEYNYLVVKDFNDRLLVSKAVFEEDYEPINKRKK